MLLDRLGAIDGAIMQEFPVLGLARTIHLSTRRKPLSFAARPSLVEIYADSRKFDDVVFSKAVQTGISEWMIQFILDAAGWRGRIAAYVLPSYKVRNRFVQQRINRLLLTVPAYRDRCPGGSFSDEKSGAENLALKRFGHGALMFLGSETETDFVEFSADVLIVDEFDSCDAGNIAMAWNRLRESPHPQRIYVGNPTIPRRGILREFDDTDGRHFFFKCSHCNQRQPIDWFLNVVQRDNDGRWVLRDTKGLRDGHVRPVCHRCLRPFEREAKGAMWVAERPGEKRRGYHMCRMDVISDDLFKLYGEFMRAQADPDLLRAFYSGVLGLGYEFEGSRLTVQQLEAAAAGQPETDHAGGEAYKRFVVTAGADVGSVINVTVSVVERDDNDNPIRRARRVCAVRTFEELADIFRRYRVDVAVVDAAPEFRKAQELRDTFVDEGGTVVWLAQFHPTPRVGTQKYGMKLDYSTQVVQADRTAVFDATYDDIANGRRTFPGDVFGVVGWSDQMRAPIRVTDPNKGRIIWTEGSAADHYRLADVYDRMATDLVDMGGSYFSGSTSAGDEDDD